MIYYISKIDLKQEVIVKPQAEKKREAIIAAASDVFLKHGFMNASMDAIAAAAPVSKATLYKYFKDKKDLFSEAVRSRCEQLLLSVSIGAQNIHQTEETLRNIARSFMDTVYSRDAISVLRILCVESLQFPDLSVLYFENGPKIALLTLAKHFEEMGKEKILDISDPFMAANMFVSLLKGELYTQCLLGMRDGITEKEADYMINESVSLFINKYKI